MGRNTHGVLSRRFMLWGVLVPVFTLVLTMGGALLWLAWRMPEARTLTLVCVLGMLLAMTHLMVFWTIYRAQREGWRGVAWTLGPFAAGAVL